MPSELSRTVRDRGETDAGAEGAAFDAQIQERVRHGHVPDLRRVTPCDWFYNNPWRRPYLVDMIFGRYFRFALRHLQGRDLLEVGSGPGHMALEFARHGFHVVGLELSGGSAEIARRTAAENPFTEGFGSLRYVVADFLTWNAPQGFDGVCFFGSLHHFANVDGVLARVEALLSPGGRLIVVEPARDWLGTKDAAVIALIRLLLAANGHWHEPLPLPETPEDLRRFVAECLREYREARDRGEEPQSPHDNAAPAGRMLDGLRARYDEIAYEPGFAFMPRMGGGIRAPSEESASRLAHFLNLFDAFGVNCGLLQPGGFLWAGQRRAP